MSGGQHRDDESERAERLGLDRDEIDRRLRRATHRLEGALALMGGCAGKKKQTDAECLDTAGVVRDVVEAHHCPARQGQIGHDEAHAREQLPGVISTFATTRRAVFQLAAR
jgi:hypothetical protein